MHVIIHFKAPFLEQASTGLQLQQSTLWSWQVPWPRPSIIIWMPPNAYIGRARVASTEHTSGPHNEQRHIRLHALLSEAVAMHQMDHLQILMKLLPLSPRLMQNLLRLFCLIQLPKGHHRRHFHHQRLQRQRPFRRKSPR